MNTLNEIKSLFEHITQKLCDHPDSLDIKYQSMATLSIKIDIVCDERDKQHIIGKKGNTIQAVRTILHSTAAKDGWKTYISVD